MFKYLYTHINYKLLFVLYYVMRYFINYAFFFCNFLHNIIIVAIYFVSGKLHSHEILFSNALTIIKYTNCKFANCVLHNI